MPRNNTPGVGGEYEVYVPALFALILNNSKVENFLFRGNDREYGKFDDLVIDVETKTEKLYFAFQLKHKKKKQQLLPTSFTANDDFNLKKYCNSFKKLKKDHRKYHFILYTNANFKSAGADKVTSFKMSHQSDLQKERFIFTPDTKAKNIYKFDVNQQTKNNGNVTRDDYQQFFSQFSLFLDQKNYTEMEKNITKILKCSHEIVLKYIDLFRKWNHEQFSNNRIDKKTVNLHLVDCFLSPFIILKDHSLSVQPDRRLKLLQMAVRKFDVTVIEASEEHVNFNCFHPLKIPKTEIIIMRIAKDAKIVDRNAKDLEPAERQKILHYFCKQPIVVRFDASSMDMVYRALELCHLQKYKIKVVLLGHGFDKTNFSKLVVLEKLSDLHKNDRQLYKSIVEKFRISLQGRPPTSLKTLFYWHKETENFFGMKEVFGILNGNNQIGEEEEILPSNYISRNIVVNVFKLEDVLTSACHKGDLLIVSVVGCFNENCNRCDFPLLRTVAQKKHVDVINIHNYLLDQQTTNNVLIVAANGCSVTQFDSVCKKNPGRNVHVFKVLFYTTVILLMSTKNNFKNVEIRKINLEELLIPSFCTGPINVVCANPGTGKSTLFKYFKNNCSAEFWTVAVELKTLYTHFKDKLNTKDFFQLLEINLESQEPCISNLKQIFFQKKSVIFFLDGLDELETDLVDNVLVLIKELFSSGYRVWVSSRQHLKNKIEEQLNVFSLDILELNTEEQEKYIVERLRKEYEVTKIETITTQIFTAIDVSTRQFLGVPLHLFILTQIFLDNKYNEDILNENFFNVAKMYRFFFEGKYKYVNQKRGCENQQLHLETLEDYLKKYEIPALQFCFSNAIICELSIDTQESGKFLENISNRGDLLDIISKVKDGKKVAFKHYTFAEYFACSFLAKNFDKVRLLKQHFFSDQYQHLRMMFDLILAEECPLHLAVIYKNVDQINCHAGNAKTYDKGGRNALHIATSYCTRHPRVRCYTCFSFIFGFEDSLLSSLLNGENLQNKTILKILSKFNPLEKDKLFSWNSLDYCQATESLFCIEAFLATNKNVKHLDNFLRNYWHGSLLAYYSSRFAYPNILHFQLKRRNDYLQGAIIEYSRIIRGLFPRIDLWDTLLHIAVKPNCNSCKETDAEIKVIKLLIASGIPMNATNRYGITALDWATARGRIKTAELLSQAGAKSIDMNNESRESDLYKAVKEGNIDLSSGNISRDNCRKALMIAANKNQFKTVQFLLEYGVHINPQETGILFLKAAKNGIVELINILLCMGVNINIKDEAGNTALHLATAQGQFQVVENLLTRGANPNVQNNYGNTPLHEAATATIDVFLTTKEIFTTFYDIIISLIVIIINFLDIVILAPFALLKHTTGSEMFNTYYNSLWQYIIYLFSITNNKKYAKIKHRNLVETLLNHKADVNVVNNEGYTPLSLAVERKNFHIVGTILAKGGLENVKFLTE